MKWNVIDTTASPTASHSHPLTKDPWMRVNNSSSCPFYIAYIHKQHSFVLLRLGTWHHPMRMHQYERAMLLACDAFRYSPKRLKELAFNLCKAKHDPTLLGLGQIACCKLICQCQWDWAGNQPHGRWIEKPALYQLTEPLSQPDSWVRS